MALGVTDQARLVAALGAPKTRGAEEGSVSVLETHISYVLLTGTYAYKIKKAVDFGFLDFTTLEARKRFCEQEVRLNRRLAPELYLDVVPITGGLEAPMLGGSGPALEYAVKMREFPQSALAGGLLARNELVEGDIDALAAQVAGFHAAVGMASPDGAFGAPAAIHKVAMQNFAQIRPLLTTADERSELDALTGWTEREFRAREATFRARQQGGFVRECHGDLHLGNIARVDGRLAIFDCIEFNDAMRWIDVMSDVAFMVMDLQDRRRADLAQRFLNAYLEITGDYAGLAVLRFYLAYRAMVRAKVQRLRAAQLESGAARASALAEYRGYVALARSYTEAPRPALVLAHGVSGCGKTTLTQTLLELAGAVRIRSDVERKRLRGLAPRERAGTGIEQGLYAQAATDATYRRACTLAREVAAAGFVAIVDATFLRRWQRDLFRALANDLRVPLLILDFTARESVLRERVAKRAAAGSDASDADLAVLQHQLRTRDPLAADERAFAVEYDAEAPLERARAPDAWRPVLARLAAASAAHAEADATSVGDPGLGAKVAFLSRPDSYAEGPSRVDVVETHMSWVFLTDARAWKLKKPVRTAHLDFSTAAARRRDCEEELRLNRRLCDDVYLDVVPLTVDEGARLRLAPGRQVVDWLVKMRRLPAGRMLDRLIRDGSASAEDVRRVVRKLARFYRGAPPVSMTPERYRAEFTDGIAENRRELGIPAYGLPAEAVDALCARQSAMLDSQPELFAERVAAGRVVEAHGDLRPEHVCLEPEPQIIDCLEFSLELRTLDAADELAFLALECERLGAPELAATIFAAYAEETGDRPPAPLLAFYRSYRACVRAKLAIRHLNDAAPRDPARWAAQARRYLQLAAAGFE